MNKTVFIQQRQEAIKKAELEIQELLLMEDLFGEYWLNIALRFAQYQFQDIGQLLNQMCGCPKKVPSELRWKVIDEEIAHSNMGFSQFREYLRLRDATKPINFQETCIYLLDTIKIKEDRQILEENLGRIPATGFSQLNSIYQKYGPQIIAQAIIKIEPFTKYDLHLGFINLENWLKSEITPPDCPFIVEQYFEAKFGVYDIRSIRKLGEMTQLYDQELVLFAMSTFPGEGLLFKHIVDIAERYQIHPRRDVDSTRFMDYGYEFPLKLDSILDEEIFLQGFDNDTVCEISTPCWIFEIVQEEQPTTFFPPSDDEKIPEEPDWEEYGNADEVQEPNLLIQDEESDKEEDEDEDYEADDGL